MPLQALEVYLFSATALCMQIRFGILVQQMEEVDDAAMGFGKPNESKLRNIRL